MCSKQIKVLRLKFITVFRAQALLCLLLDAFVAGRLISHLSVLYRNVHSVKT